MCGHLVLVRVGHATLGLRTTIIAASVSRHAVPDKRNFRPAMADNMSKSCNFRPGETLESPHKSKSGLVRIWRAFSYTLDGLAAALKHEHAFRQELILCAVLLPVALWMPVTPVERLLLLGPLLLVLVVELLNSSIEAVVDRVSLENHALSKRAKDLGSAAVFLSLMVVALSWGLIAGPLLWAWLHGTAAKTI